MSPLQILIVANLLPVAGVVFFDWDLATIILAYWVENIAVGYWAIRKIQQASKDDVNLIVNGEVMRDSTKQTRSLIGFFIIHYGLFTVGHGVFVISFFGLPDQPVLIPVFMFVSLLISHGVSFYVNYLGKGEYKNTTPGTQMFLPYKRIIIMHLVVIGGGFLISFSEGIGGMLTLLLLVALKTVVDIISHIFEHRKTTAKA